MSFDSCTDEMPFLWEVTSQIAMNHLRSSILVLSKRVPVLTLKYFPVFLQRYLLPLHLYTFEVASKGLTITSPQIIFSKWSIHDCSSGKVDCKSNNDLNSNFITVTPHFLIVLYRNKEYLSTKV